MKVQSTGLGKTVMLAHFQDLSKTRFEGEQVLQMNMESTEPLHWTIKVYMEPEDIRQAVLKGLKPQILWKAFLALVFGRFSLFGNTAAVSEEIEINEEQAEKKDMPVKSEEKNRTDESTGSPLAGLKSDSSKDTELSPLAKLKG